MDADILDYLAVDIEDTFAYVNQPDLTVIPPIDSDAKINHYNPETGHLLKTVIHTEPYAIQPGDFLAISGASEGEEDRTTYVIRPANY
jgi:hypothetical protein